MKCPICDNAQVEMTWGCAITHPNEPNETVERSWYCEECNSAGNVGYVQDYTSIIFGVIKGVKQRHK